MFTFAVIVLALVAIFAGVFALTSATVARTIARVFPSAVAEYREFREYTPVRFSLTFRGWLSRVRLSSRTLIVSLSGHNAFAITLPHGFVGNCFNGVALNIYRFPLPLFRSRRTGKLQLAQCAAIVLTVRTGYGKETTFYFSGLKFWWNSAHLARKYGKFIDTDFGGVWQWRGHLDL